VRATRYRGFGDDAAIPGTVPGKPASNPREGRRIVMNEQVGERGTGTGYREGIVGTFLVALMLFTFLFL